MATPKINNISLLFARGINDSRTSAGVEFTAGTEAGKVLSAAQRMYFINQAFFYFTGIMWKMLKGDKHEYAKMFPELVRTASINTDASAKYPIANPNLDYDELLELTITDGSTVHYAEIAPKDSYQALTYGPLQARGAANQPRTTEIAKVIYVTPAGTFASKAATLTIITQPLNPTDGSALTQGGDYDSPFKDKWTMDIVKLAIEIYEMDLQSH